MPPPPRTQQQQPQQRQRSLQHPPSSSRQQLLSDALFSKSTTTKGASKIKNGGDVPLVDWPKDVQYALQSGRWENVRGNLQLCTAARHRSKDRSASGAGGFWNAIQQQQQQLLSSKQQRQEADRSKGLFEQDDQGRTPLYFALASRKAVPIDVIRSMIQLEPRSTQLRNDRGRLPIHAAVLYRHPIETIAALVDANPISLSAVDRKGQSSLGYAVEIAKSETDLRKAPKSYWMPSTGDDDELEQWQQEQSERWGVVHWLLLSFATYPQNLSVLVEGSNGGSKSKSKSSQPMLVDALLYAAPPAVIMLLIGASVMLLSVENRASAFAGSTLYSCIARHYPLSILQSLTMQCPKDVRTVRDETGMGLVSAQFVSGCFGYDVATGEWKVHERMLSAMEKCIEQAKLCKDDPTFVDWWHKIEFLVSFCDEDGDSVQDTTVKREFLLHHSLCNPDIPPRVVRLLVALYPDSIVLRNPSKGNTLPIHLAAKNQEYIPRNYESLIMEEETTASELLLQTKPETVNYRHEKTLPLHLAIAAGKTLSSLDVFLTYNEGGRRTSSLRKRDPVTGLYPFQQVAAYTMVSTQDGYRWSCVARNQYSHVGWKRLTDQEKASAILNVADSENTERLSTAYVLLRRKPTVISPAQAKKGAASSFRDVCGMGSTSLHFISFNYTQTKRGEWVLNTEKSEIFKSALRAAKQTGLSRNPVFFKWWQKMKFWIRYCDPPRDNAAAIRVRKALPKNADQYLLHAALTNPDTPPQVVDLLLALFPESARRTALTSWLPLHIACLTTAYTPRSFEELERSSIELTLNANPEAARSFADGNLPLHLAIRSGRTWEELWYLVEEEPRALKVRDQETKLYPFQMLCTRRKSSAEQQLQYQYVARNWFTEQEWVKMTPRERVSEIRNARRDHQLAILSSAYELLRKDASVIENYNEAYREDTVISSRVNCSITCDAGEAIRSFGDDDQMLGDGDDEFCESDEGESDSAASQEWDSDSEMEGTDEGNYESDSEGNIRRENSPAPSDDERKSSTAKEQRPSLMSFFSREQQKSRHQSKQNVYECDASVISGVDMMSLVSNTGHPSLNHKSRRGRRRKADDKTPNPRSVSDVFGDACAYKDDTSHGDTEEGDDVSDSFAGDSTDFFGEQDDEDTGYFSTSSGNEEDFLCLADLAPGQTKFDC